MSDFTPRHRGTARQFKVEAPYARDWFMAQCRRLVEDQDQPIQDILEEQFAQIDAAENKDGVITNGAFFRMDCHRETSGWVYTGNLEHTDYMWWFEIGDSGRTTYGSRQKIKIRKDGSIHEENLKNAMTYWASREISRRRCADNLATNTAEWEELQSPGKHDPFITVELSKGKLGMCSIQYSNTWVKLGKVHDVPIRNAQRMIDKMRSVAENFATDMVEIRDDL